MTTIPSTNPIVITPNLLAATMNQGLLTDQTSLATLEQQISTGNAINVASDNPPGAANLLQLQSGLTRTNQYASNANDGKGWLTLANSTVGSVLSNLQSVLSLVQSVSGQSLTGQATTRQATADQVAAALTSITNLANTTYEGNQLLFAGTGGTTQAYDQNGNYVGGGSAPARTVAPGTQIPISLTGPQIFGPASGPGGTTTPALLGNNAASAGPGVLRQIVNDLGSGNLTAVEGTDLTNLQASISKVEGAAGQLGAYQQQVEGFAQQASASSTALTQELGNVQSTNVAQAITSLQLQQTAYQEALYATSQLSTDSLAKYL